MEVGPADLLKVRCKQDGKELYAEHNIDGSLDFRTVAQQSQLETENEMRYLAKWMDDRAKF